MSSLVREHRPAHYPSMLEDVKDNRPVGQLIGWQAMGRFQAIGVHQLGEQFHVWHLERKARRTIATPRGVYSDLGDARTAARTIWDEYWEGTAQST